MNPDSLLPIPSGSRQGGQNKLVLPADKCNPCNVPPAETPEAWTEERAGKEMLPVLRMWAFRSLPPGAESLRSYILNLSFPVTITT